VEIESEKGRKIRGECQYKEMEVDDFEKEMNRLTPTT
jgi:hypothetical protein